MIEFNPGEVAKILDADIWRAKRTIAFAAFTRIAGRTPVDTGTARNNWTVSAGEPDRTIKAAPGTPGAMPMMAAVAEAPPGGNINVPLYITNNLPYIVPLEQGHSRQAPGGMVDLTLAELQSGMIDL